MKIFTNLYDYIINLANKKNVDKYLYGLSFIESFIFPIPPDILLAPLALTRKYNWIKLAFNTTCFSVAGGIIGYILGSYLYEISLFNNIISDEMFFESKKLFDEHGFIIIVVAGFTPLPYKAFTITAGYLSIAIFPFILSSLIGRGLRFFMVSAIFHFFGIDLANRMKKYFEYIGVVVTIILMLIIYYKYFI
tara:strand:+ start:1728 stop:2303 length:576 start_codon:yes stop_codon:yes gene_type:complete